MRQPNLMKPHLWRALDRWNCRGQYGCSTGATIGGAMAAYRRKAQEWHK